MAQSRYTSKLKGARVLVIGGTSGLGFGVAEGALANGATVIISSSNKQRVSDKVNKLKSIYPNAEISGHVCDLSNSATLESNVIHLLEAVGKVDHIVSTAGNPVVIKPLTEWKLEEMMQMAMVRFYAPLIIAKHAPKYLTGGPRSSITLTTGAVSQKPLPNWTVTGSYATGLQGMTRLHALELKPIRVNLVSPGPVDTEWWRMPEEQKQLTFEQIAGKMPTGRVGRVEDVVEAYLDLMKDENATGSMVSTNSGSLLV